MLEKSFEIFGKFIKRHAIKFIIIWLLIAVIMLPFSTIIFSETSYDIASSVVTSNSMSARASDIIQQQFPSQNTSGNATVDLVLVENANVSDRNVIKTFMEMRNAMLNNETLKKYNVSVSDIYTIENDLMMNFSKNAKILLNSTFLLNNRTKFLVMTLVEIGNYSIEYMNGVVYLYKNVRSSYVELLNNTNSSLSIEFGIPEYFVNVFLYEVNTGHSISVSNSIAYQATLSFIENNLTFLKSVLVPYLQNFTYFWSFTMTDPSLYQIVEEYSIRMTLYNSSFSNSFSSNEMVSFWKVLGNYFNVTNWQNFSAVKSFAINYIGNELSQNATVVKMLPLGVGNFMASVASGENASKLAIKYAYDILNDTEKSFIFSFFPGDYFSVIFNKNTSFVENYTLENVAENYSRNSSISKFASALYINIYDLVKSAYYSKNITALSADEVKNSLIHNLYGNPLINPNKESIYNYIISLKDTKNIDEFVNGSIINGSFNTYPVVPSPYIFHQFVSYVGNVSLFIVSLDQSAPISTLNIIGNISNEYITQIKNASYLLAGEKAIEVQLTNESNSGLYRALFVGIGIAIIISFVFFRSPIAGLIPLLIFGLSSIISLGINGLLYKYVFHTQVSFITPTLLLILLLGLTTDYSVYIISRFRRELRNRNLRRGEVTIQWAGHAVFTSGLTVIISYVTLWLANVPLFSDSGLTNAISISMTVVLALTFLPSLLVILDRRVFWPSRVENVPRHEKIMERISRFDKKNRVALLAIFVVITLLSFYVYEVTPSGMDVFELVPHQSGLQAVQVINQTFRGDTVFPNYVVLVFPGKVISNGTYNESALNIINSTENYLLNTGKVSFVYGPTYPFGNYVNPLNLGQFQNSTKSIYLSKINSYIGSDNRTVVIYFQLSMLSWSESAMSFIKNLDAKIAGVIPSDVQWYIGGLAQGLIDANNHTVSVFDFIVPIIAIAALFVLLVQFNSVFTPIRLVLMVLGSVLFSLVITYGIFYYTLNMPIIIFLPLFVFITLLAVGLDYDIFMITRVREEVIKGRSDEEGIETSLKENGMVISVLGLILVSTFLSLYLSSIGIIQEMGVGLALGVLVDSFISWMFFIPAVMLILKSYNWWPSKIGKK